MPAPGIFLSGSLMRHVAVMTLTSSVGLLAMFFVDFINLFFISQLGDPALTAAIGFASTLTFFNSALNIGLMITVSALAARRIGVGETEEARKLLTHILIMGIALSMIISAIFWTFSPQFMDFMGATGAARTSAIQYVSITLPFAPLIVIGMICSGFLRAHGNARGAMNTTLAMAATNAIFDPLFIFGLDFGFVGAAYATVLATIAMALVGLAPVLRSYGGFAPLRLAEFKANYAAISTIMFASVLTNLATPVGGLIAFRYIAEYGEQDIAAYAVIGRIIPLAFCLMFSLSGSVGPIIGQNFGARRLDRVRGAIDNAVLFAVGYTVLIWPVMYFAADPIAEIFGLGDEGSDLVHVFAIWVVPLFLANGIIFIGNAAFNNLDRPRWSAWINWGRNTIGTLPLAWLGSELGGASGVLIGPAFGGVLFALLSLWLTRRLLAQHGKM